MLGLNESVQWGILQKNVDLGKSFGESVASNASLDNSCYIYTVLIVSLYSKDAFYF